MDIVKKSYTYHELTPVSTDTRFERYLEKCKRCKTTEPITPNTKTRFYLNTGMVFVEKTRYADWVVDTSLDAMYTTFRHEWNVQKVGSGGIYDGYESPEEDLPIYIECCVWNKNEYRLGNLKSIEASWSTNRICGPQIVILDRNKKVRESVYRTRHGKVVDSHQYTREYEITHLKPYKHHKVLKADRDFMLMWYRYFVEPSLPK